MFLEALELKKKMYGEVHNQVATSYNNLGYLYQSQKRINKGRDVSYINTFAILTHA